MKAIEELPPEVRNSPFTVAQAQVLGLSYGQLRHRDILSLSRGIKVIQGQDDAALSLALLTRPYTLVTGYSAASHATAFALWDLPGFLPGPQPELFISLVSIPTQYRGAPASEAIAPCSMTTRYFWSMAFGLPHGPGHGWIAQGKCPWRNWRSQPIT